MYEKEDKLSVDIIRLYQIRYELLRISPIEIEKKPYTFIKFAKGKGGVVGLGLKAICSHNHQKDEVLMK